MPKWRSWLSVLFTWRALIVLMLWGGSLAAATLAGAFANARRDRILAFLRSGQTSQIIQTNLYNLLVQKVSIPAEGRDGGIDPLGDGILFVNRLGNMWYVDGDRRLHDLDLTVPINFEEFESDPYNVNTVDRALFAVKDLLVQPRGSGVRLLASYNFWNSDHDCYMVRVAMLETDERSVLENSPGLQDDWKVVYDTPCGRLTENPNTGNRNPSLGSGGRMAALSDSRILITIGGFGPENLDPTASRSQSLDNPFGKTLVLDLATGDSRIFTLGHRNPQGLTISSTGEIWETEHGARGGDELNRLIDGGNYGFPLVSYGTRYESMEWPINPRQGRHDGFEKPMYAWVPSIGVSQVTTVDASLFEHWRGDVLVSSLGRRTLYRVRVEDGRTVFAETIPILHRIRDMTEANDGAIVLKTDDDFLVFIRPVETAGVDLSELEPELRGQLLATGCSGCHTVQPGAADGIGPNLWGIVGEAVAAREGYEYSDALRSLGGRWAAERLAAFLADPQALAPGTGMLMTRSYEDEEIADLLAYLRTLR